MKKLIHFIFILILFCIFDKKSQAQQITIIDQQTKNSYRGISSYKNNIWVSGSNGTIGFSIDNGNTWKYQQTSGFEKIDFRDIHVFDENNIIIMGIASPAYILRSNDAGKTWKTVYTNNDPNAFLDAFYFTKNKGICLGDPIHQKPFTIITKDNGETWQEKKIFNNTMIDGEAFYAASGTNILINKNKYYVVSGGTQSRLLLNEKTTILPTMQGLKMTGANSIAQWGKNLVIMGGDYENLNRNDSVAAYSTNDGKTWHISKTQPNGYKSCVIFINKNTLIACGLTGVDISKDGGKNWQNISKLSFNSCVYNQDHHTVYFCGANGKIGKLSL